MKNINVLYINDFSGSLVELEFGDESYIKEVITKMDIDKRISSEKIDLSNITMDITIETVFQNSKFSYSKKVDFLIVDLGVVGDSEDVRKFVEKYAETGNLFMFVTYNLCKIGDSYNIEDFFDDKEFLNYGNLIKSRKELEDKFKQYFKD